MKMTNRFNEVAQLKALPGRREAIIKRSQSFDSPAPGREDHGGRKMNYEEEIDLLRNEVFELRKGEDTRIIISELMARIDMQADRIAELESKIADLEKRNEDLTYRLGKEQVAAMQDRDIQLQKYIRELEKKVEFWSGVAMKYAPDEEVMEG